MDFPPRVRKTSSPKTFFFERSSDTSSDAVGESRGPAVESAGEFAARRREPGGVRRSDRDGGLERGRRRMSRAPSTVYLSGELAALVKTRSWTSCSAMLKRETPRPTPRPMTHATRSRGRVGVPRGAGAEDRGTHRVAPRGGGREEAPAAVAATGGAGARRARRRGGEEPGRNAAERAGGATTDRDERESAARRQRAEEETADAPRWAAAGRGARAEARPTPGGTTQTGRSRDDGDAIARGVAGKRDPRG